MKIIFPFRSLQIGQVLCLIYHLVLLLLCLQGTSYVFFGAPSPRQVRSRFTPSANYSIHSSKQSASVTKVTAIHHSISSLWEIPRQTHHILVTCSIQLCHHLLVSMIDPGNILKPILQLNFWVHRLILARCLSWLSRPVQLHLVAPLQHLYRPHIMLLTMLIKWSLEKRLEFTNQKPFLLT